MVIGSNLRTTKIVLIKWKLNSSILMYKILWEHQWGLDLFSLDNPPGKAYREGHTKAGSLKSYCVLGTVNNLVAIWYIPAKQQHQIWTKNRSPESLLLRHNIKPASKLILLKTNSLTSENNEHNNEWKI